MGQILDGVTDKKELTEFDGLDADGVKTLMAVMNSKSTSDAAAALGITRQALWIRTKKYNIDKIIADFPKEALMRLQLGSTRAADVLVEKLESRSESLQAATEILDRVGLTGGNPPVLQQFNVKGEMSVEFGSNDD